MDALLAFVYFSCYTIKNLKPSRRKRLHMNCKFCNAELEDGVIVCPQCVKELSEESDQETTL